MYDIKSFKSATKMINNRVYTDYFYRLMLLSKSLFKWNNLPDGIDERFIERFLFTEGECLFFRDEKLGFMVTKLVPNGQYNAYLEPTLVRPFAYNYEYTGKALYNNDNCVIIRNNDDSIPTLPTIELYAQKLTNIDRTIEVNILNQKTPLIITCTDKQKLSLKNIITQRNENEFAIYGDKGLDVDNTINVLDLKSPVVFDKLQIQKHDIWNECMTFLGINNANQDKRERLVKDEVSANNEQVSASEDIMLKARQNACKLINEMFGLNISVERRNIGDGGISKQEIVMSVVKDGD